MIMSMALKWQTRGPISIPSIRMNIAQTAALSGNRAAITAAPRMPPQIPFIIANEGCERFSFYGMRNILTVFLMSSLLLATPAQMAWN